MPEISYCVVAMALNKNATVESANGVATSQRVTDHENANLNLVDNTAVLNAAITISGSGDESGVNFLISYLYLC